jgi:hypothetical protein
MDPNYVDEEEEAAAMAAMMGFSGFGSQKPPAKKRKFATDAFVEGQEPVDKGGKKGQGSGGNTMPLGKTRVLGTGSASKAIQPVAVNDAEIPLDDDEEPDGPQYVDTSLPPPILAGEDVSHQPQFVAPLGVSDEEAKEMQSRIDVRSQSFKSSERLLIPRTGRLFSRVSNPESPHTHLQTRKYPITYLKDRISILQMR